MIERRPLHHDAVSSTPKSRAGRVVAAARLGPDRSNAARLVAIVLRNLSSPSAFVRAEAEKEVLALPLADRQKLYATLGRVKAGSRVKAGNGMSLAEATSRAAALRVTGPK